MIFTCAHIQGGSPIETPSYGGKTFRFQEIQTAMNCPFCQKEETRVLDTTPDARGGVRRRRECEHCHKRFSTYERPVTTLPLIIKQDGTREEFDREKVIRGIRIACTKRPVSADQIDKIATGIETALKESTRQEMPARVIGDMVIASLKELDQVAYIRYASVYLPLDDVKSLRDEIDRLLLEG
jgi:transcriptional repressor NrdR